MPDAKPPAAAVNRALIFDFDGLILDTEWADFQTWKKVFADHGQPLEIEDYVHAVGTPKAMDFHALLEARRGAPVDWPAVDAARLKHRARVFDDMDVMPGVREIMLEGAARGWRIGVASSSPMSWVFGHLRSHGLDAWVETMRTGEDGVPLKPAPDLYQLACRDLGADPARSLAFEDSATGVRAALAAGLHVIAVPNRITQHHDLSGAHSVVKSLQGFRLPA